MNEKLFQETECTVCDKAILASEPRYRITISRQPDSWVIEDEIVCECCMEEVRKAMGYEIAKKDTV